MDRTQGANGDKKLNTSASALGTGIDEPLSLSGASRKTRKVVGERK